MRPISPADSDSKVTKRFFTWPKGRLARVFVTILVILAIWGVGRTTQKAIDSVYFGERAPYLQMLAPHAVTIRWQTKGSQKGVVWFGTAPDHLARAAADQDADDEHEVRLSGLKADTRYYYAVGDASGIHWGGDAQYHFTTAPAAEDVPLRLWVIGDSGSAGDDQQAVRRALDRYLAAHPRSGRPELDLFMTLGDNAYRSGTAEQYQEGFFDAYPKLLRTVGVWPVFGNHDARRWVYYDIFSLPEKGEVGGVPSGTESYFSFDHGPLHVVILDSENSDRSPNGDMATWLRKDLAANTRPWTIAAFHHPPYTRGGHDSDSTHDSWGRMAEMRENIVPILEDGGVDLVLGGHAHDYERSYLLDCHYGPSSTLQPRMILEQQGPFRKAPGPHQGTIYVVAGSSSKLDGGVLNHPAMKVGLVQLGSLLIDIRGNRLTGRFLDTNADVRDEFTIVKDPNAPRRAGGCR